MVLEFIGDINKDEVVKMLLSAYADEWITAYYYTLTAYAIKGPLS